MLRQWFLLRPHKLLIEEADVETDIVPNKCPAGDERCDLGGAFLEAGLVFQGGVREVREILNDLGEVTAGVEFLYEPVRNHAVLEAEERDFDDPVELLVQPGGLHIHDDAVPEGFGYLVEGLALIVSAIGRRGIRGIHGDRT